MASASSPGDPGGLRSGASVADPASRLPLDHPLRTELNDEVHARPPQALVPPLRISYLALLADPAAREQSWQAVRDLALRYGAQPPCRARAITAPTSARSA